MPSKKQRSKMGRRSARLEEKTKKNKSLEEEQDECEYDLYMIEGIRCCVHKKTGEVVEYDTFKTIGVFKDGVMKYCDK